MIRHVVAFRLAAEDVQQKRADASSIQQQLESLPGRVPHVDRLEVGVDLGLVPSHWDVVLVSEHATGSELEAYQSHPEHVRTAQAISPMIADRACVDYEL